MNPRGQAEAAEARRRSATMWKIIVAVVTAAAAATVIVASCHDQRERERARRDVAEPAHVETTSASATASSTSIRASESPTASPLAGTRLTEEGEAIARPVPPVVTAPPASTVVPPAPMPDAATAAPPSTRDSAGGIVGVPGSVVTAPRVSAPPAYAQSAAPATPAADAQAPAPAPAPAPTVGAGRFITEAPYWGSSAFPFAAEAGAGPIQ